MKRVNIQIPDDVHQQAKLLSVLTNTTLNDYLAAAVLKAVEKDKAKLQQLKLKL